MTGGRRGASEAGVLRACPCDGLAASPVLQAWRGIRIQPPAGAVRPRVAQIRLAPYSCDRTGNRGRRSPRELAGLPEPRAGDRFTTAGGPALGRVMPADPGRQLTGTLMFCVLVPQDDDATRQLLKVITPPRRRAAPALSAGDLIKARRQLLNLKNLAGRHYRQESPRPSPLTPALPAARYRPGALTRPARVYEPRAKPGHRP
jgi:hypothetical protein